MVRYFSCKCLGVQIKIIKRFFFITIACFFIFLPFIVHEETSQNLGHFFRCLSYSPSTIDTSVGALGKMSTSHLLGTDDQGRDVFVRLIYGARESIVSSFCFTMLTIIFACLFGFAQAFLGKKCDIAIYTTSNILVSFPHTYLFLLTMSFFDYSFSWFVVAMSFLSWIPLSRIIASECMKIRSYPYVIASYLLGCSFWHIFKKHVFKELCPHFKVSVPILMGYSMITLTSFDFLGLSLNIVTLGDILIQGKQHFLYAPQILVSGCLTLTLIVLCCNIVTKNNNF